MNKYRFRSLLPIAAALGISACGDDGDLTDPPRSTPRSIVVLDGYVQPGLTLLPDSGPGSSRIVFGSPNEFDGGSLEIKNDIAVAASSRGAGDLLYVASLESGIVRRIQMPARSNPARARLLAPGTGGASLIAVPLRDSRAVALVTLSASGESSIEMIRELGACPIDVFQNGTDLWVVDANARCSSDYASLGEMQLIRIPSGSGSRQTITLTGLYGSSAGVVVEGGIAYISAGGSADFSAFPYQLLNEGAIGRVRLRDGVVLASKSMPEGSYGASSRLGMDGKLYVSLYESLGSFANRTIAYTLPDLNPSGARVESSDWLRMVNEAGSQVDCSSSIADGSGRVHCISARGAQTWLMVFAPDGSFIREAAAGQGGVDLQFR